MYIGIFFECQLHKIQLCIVLSRVYLLYALGTGLKVGPDYFVLDIGGYAVEEQGLGLGSVVALNQINTKTDNGLQLLKGLNSLCQRFQLIIVAELYDRCDQLLLLQIIVYIADERAVYLDVIGGVVQQV